MYSPDRPPKVVALSDDLNYIVEHRPRDRFMSVIGGNYSHAFGAR